MCKINKAVPINHVRHIERENFFWSPPMVWFSRRKEHRCRGTARKIANWYTENINKTAVRIPMIYCKVWLNSFDSVYPFAARTTLSPFASLRCLALFFIYIVDFFFLTHSFIRRCKVARCKTGNIANDTNVSCYNPSPFPVALLQLSRPSLHRLLLRFILFDPREWKEVCELSEG